MPDFTQPVNKPLLTGRFRQVAGLAAVAIALTGCQTNNTFTSYPINDVTEARPDLQISKFASGSKNLSSQSNDETLAEWKNSIFPLFEQARVLVETKTGQDLSDVKLRLANDTHITNEVTHETSRLVNKQFSNKNFASHFLNSVMKGQTGTYAALYATRTSEVMVSEPLMRSYQRSLPADKNIQRNALLALLIHELVHAADDRRYKIHENRKLNFRASFAQSAAFEGHAQFVTRSICEKANCSDGLEALDEFMFGKRSPPNQLTQSVQAVSRNVLEYSYIEGERFVESLAKRPNGQLLIDKLLSEPPQDPIQILDPASYPNTSREARNQRLISAAGSFQHPWLTTPWTSVQTSPLKGVNLRTDPSRRNAAVDGFTRLITSMVALQLYNQSAPGQAPIEVTVIKADKTETAELFAKTLHQNTRINGAVLSSESRFRKVADPVQAGMLYLTKEPDPSGKTYYTLVGVNDLHVVQISGLGTSELLFVDFIYSLLLELASKPAGEAFASRVKFTNSN